MKFGRDEGFAAKFNFVRSDAMNDYEKEPWYFGEMSREDAENFLENRANSDGSFLVRRTTSSGGMDVLSIKCFNFDDDSEVVYRYEHHAIKKDSDSVWLTDDPSQFDKYPDLTEMIEAHRRKKRKGFHSNLTSVCVIPSPHTDPTFEHFDKDHDSRSVPQSQIRIGRVISSKRSGDVEKAKLQGFIDVVVKQLKFKNEEDGSEALTKFFDEIGNLKRLDHPNIVQLFGFTTNAEQERFLIQEMMTKGDLKSQLQKMLRRGDSGVGQRLLFWAFQVARGMKKLESLKIIHGDLAARLMITNFKCNRSLRNVLLDQFGRAKVSNYGLTNMELEGPEKLERLMMERWMAPEALYSQERTHK